MTRTFHDINGAETTEDALDVDSVRYTIEVPVAIEGPSVEQILVDKDTTVATFEFVYPNDSQLFSSPPITGTFYAKCYHPDGREFSTPDMGFSTSANDFKNVLETYCSFLKGKIRVTISRGTYANSSLGREYLIWFDDIDASLVQYTLAEGFEPIQGVEV